MCRKYRVEASELSKQDTLIVKTERRCIYHYMWEYFMLLLRFLVFLFGMLLFVQFYDLFADKTFTVAMHLGFVFVHTKMTCDIFFVELIVNGRNKGYTRSQQVKRAD